MRSRSIWSASAILVAIVALAVALVAVPAGAQDETAGGDSQKDVLRIGWAQNPSNINPFVGQDEEAYTLWAINWDLLVNFSSKDLSPTAGIAESWKISDGGKTVTFKLDPDAVWSDGKPITSADVKYSLETLGGEGALFTGYTDNVTSIEAPDDETVVVKTSRPDARVVGGLFIYVLPKHVWGKVPIDELTGTYEPELPMVGSGPYVVTDFEKGRIARMERNPNFQGPEPAFDEIQFITYGSQDAVERALKLGEIDIVNEVQAATFDQLGDEPNIETVKASQPAFTQLTFNLCTEKICPDANFNPAVQDRAVRQAIAYAIDRGRINAIAGRNTSFPAHGLLPSFYKSFYERPAMDYPLDVAKANQILDQAGYTREGDGVRSKDGNELSFNLYVRSESPYNVQAAKLAAEQVATIGVKFNVQVVSTDKMYEVTLREVDGKPAPDFDTFIWGWGGDPYDPSFLLQLLTTRAIADKTSDSFYSNPAYDRLFDEQAGAFDTAERREIVQRMVAINQRDLAYLVLTYDPNLQAYRTDKLANVERICPEDETGDIFCESIGYSALLNLEPGESSGDDGGGGGTGIVIAIIAVIAAAIVFFVVRSRRRSREPVELEE